MYLVKGYYYDITNTDFNFIYLYRLGVCYAIYVATGWYYIPIIIILRKICFLKLLLFE